MQLWAHRPYSELLQADMLPDDLANVVIDCMRGYGATTLGVVANIGPAEPKSRAILGFISYGYAQMLLRLDRVEEYLLFLYSHRYHDHNRVSWTAGEVSGLEGDASLFCIPAQQTIPLMVRWMLVLEDPDEEKLYLGKGLPREWVISGRKSRMTARLHDGEESIFRCRRIEARKKSSRRCDWEGNSVTSPKSCM